MASHRLAGRNLRLMTVEGCCGEVIVRNGNLDVTERIWEARRECPPGPPWKPRQCKGQKKSTKCAGCRATAWVQRGHLTSHRDSLHPLDRLGSLAKNQGFLLMG